MHPTILVILASIREGRFGDKPAHWIYEIAQKRTDMSVDFVDLREYQLPLFQEAISPKYVQGAYGKKDVDRWAEKISAADGFVVVTPEYNHGYPSALKNNIDYLYKEWGKKPVAYVGYGLSGGASAISQLRTVATELEMVPMRTEIYIRDPWNLTTKDNALIDGALDHYVAVAQRQLDELAWWAHTLLAARTH